MLPQDHSHTPAHNNAHRSPFYWPLHSRTRTRAFSEHGPRWSSLLLQTRTMSEFLTCMHAFLFGRVPMITCSLPPQRLRTHQGLGEHRGPAEEDFGTNEGKPKATSASHRGTLGDGGSHSWRPRTDGALSTRPQGGSGIKRGNSKLAAPTTLDDELFGLLGDTSAGGSGNTTSAADPLDDISSYIAQQQQTTSKGLFDD